MALIGCLLYNFGKISVSRTLCQEARFFTKLQFSSQIVAHFIHYICNGSHSKASVQIILKFEIQLDNVDDWVFVLITYYGQLMYLVLVTNHWFQHVFDLDSRIIETILMKWKINFVCSSFYHKTCHKKIV